MAPKRETDSQPSGNPKELADFLQIPWRGLRTDLLLHPGPLDHDGHRSWVLEDPVRGNNYRLGYAEGELIYRLTVEPNLDKAVANLYATTPLRPTPEEILSFVTMLQNESLARLPEEEVVRRESVPEAHRKPPVFQRLLQGAIFFRVPLLRPDRFLSRTLPYVSALWSPAARWGYLLIGLFGLILTLPELELYLSTVNYLFTPQGAAAFAVCLVLLKMGHELAHGYVGKAMGLHIRSMGIFFIVFWPLLYTDTTDAWKIPDRKRRMWISGAGVLFELTVAGMALFLWALLPDGILRSLMFFLSGTSMLSSILVNLNPFMRYDGYYLLMDWWGIDNLRPRAFAMLRYAVRRSLLGWTGPVPEVHPNRRGLIVYAVCALLYRLFVGIAIALAVYYLFFPALGVLVFLVEIWIFFVRPGIGEVRAVVQKRRLIGSRPRAVATCLGAAVVIVAVFAPLPRFQHLPGLLLYRNAAAVNAPKDGRVSGEMPAEHLTVAAGEKIFRIESEPLRHEAKNLDFDLASLQARLRSVGGGGEQGAYRNWLQAELARVKAAKEKLDEAIALLEIHAPMDGHVMDVNPNLYKGAFVRQGTYLFSVGTPRQWELKAYAHEGQAAHLKKMTGEMVRVRVSDPRAPAIHARFRERSRFPVYRLPNESLLDMAGGPIVSRTDGDVRRPRDAYFALTFGISQPVPEWFPHGMPCWIWLRGDNASIAGRLLGRLWQNLTERGLL